MGLTMLCVTCFSCLDAVSKLLAAHYPIPAVVWSRYLFQVLLMVLFLGPRYGLGLVRTANPKLQILRGVVLTASSLVFLGALSRMPLAEATAIAFMAPLLVAVLAGPFLRERVGRNTWIALAAGFGGVLLIVRPGSAIFSWTSIWPLAAAVLMAVYQLLTRRVAGRDAPLTTLFIPALVGLVLVPLAFPLALELPREPLHAVLFVGVGVLGGLSHFFLIRAFEHAPASTLAPFQYAQLVVVLILGWAMFGQLPDALGLAGMATIAASGLLLTLSYRRSPAT